MGKVKSLVVIVDEGLTWNDQFKSLTGKLTAGLSSLKKLKAVFPQSKLCDVYRAFFESHLRYANVVWGSLSSVELQTLQRFCRIEPYQSSKVQDVKTRGLKIGYMLRAR